MDGYDQSAADRPNFLAEDLCPVVTIVAAQLANFSATSCLVLAGTSAASSGMWGAGSFSAAVASEPAPPPPTTPSTASKKGKKGGKVFKALH